MFQMVVKICKYILYAMSFPRKQTVYSHFHFSVGTFHILVSWIIHQGATLATCAAWVFNGGDISLGHVLFLCHIFLCFEWHPLMVGHRRLPFPSVYAFTSSDPICRGLFQLRRMKLAKREKGLKGLIPKWLPSRRAALDLLSSSVFGFISRGEEIVSF